MQGRPPCHGDDLPFARGLPRAGAAESFLRERERVAEGRSEAGARKRDRPEGVLIMHVSTHDIAVGAPPASLFRKEPMKKALCLAALFALPAAAAPPASTNAEIAAVVAEIAPARIEATI